MNLVIIDNLGKTIRSESVRLVSGSNPVNIAKLAPGMYTLRLTDDTGKVITTRFNRQ